MIFSTLNQLNIFLIFVFGGILCEIIRSVFNTLFLINFQKKLTKTIFFFIFYSFFSIFFVFLINFFNFGKLSIVTIFAFVLGKQTTKFTIKKTVVILENLWYNKIRKLLNTKEKKTKNAKSIQS